MTDAQHARTYEDGFRDGRIQALEDNARVQTSRLDAHAQRLQKIERLIWAAYGVVATFQFGPPVLEALIATLTLPAPQ